MSTVRIDWMLLHVVTPEEEDALAANRLKKLQPYLEQIKSNSLTYYHPLQHLSVDERKKQVPLTYGAVYAQEGMDTMYATHPPTLCMSVGEI